MSAYCEEYSSYSYLQLKSVATQAKSLKHRLQNKGDWKGLSLALIISSELAITIEDNVRALDNDLNCPMVCANVAGGPQE